MVLSLTDPFEWVWRTLFGGIQRGDPMSWLVVVGIILLAALLVVRRDRG